MSLKGSAGYGNRLGEVPLQMDDLEKKETSPAYPEKYREHSRSGRKREPYSKALKDLETKYALQNGGQPNRFAHTEDSGYTRNSSIAREGPGHIDRGMYN